MVYRFIRKYYQEFGVRWLLKKFKIYPNAYYNFLKNRKAISNTKKSSVLNEIKQIYHNHNGVPGHRSMRVFLIRKNIYLSKTTVHQYMNKELSLKSVVRRKRPNYVKGHAHKIFPNLLNQNFTATAINRKWCTDFTYMYLTDGSKRYNCTIIDLHDRSVIASQNGKEITSELAVNTVKKALAMQPKRTGELILHSDQGSQFTSKEFVEFCNSVNIVQSMSKAGCPYDNAPMERYYNTLKNELINLHNYRTEEVLNQAVEEFAYTIYNHVRPHSYNEYSTPFEKRHSIKSFRQ